MKKIGLILFLTLYVIISFAQQKKRTVFEDVDLVVNPVKFINTVGSDISPTFVEGYLYFSSIRESYFNKSNREKENMAFYNIHSAKLDENGIISSQRMLVPGFGSKMHEGPVAYCETTGELFTTLSSTNTFQRLFSVNDISLKLVIEKKVDDKWQMVEELPFNNDNLNFAHPAISKTGDTLIFSSNIGNMSQGKLDLFMSIRRNGKWSSPINLGDSINTSGNEMYPTFLDHNILSFASDGRSDGYGKLDIWYTSFPEIGEIKNMGSKINSHLDDFGLIIHPNKNIGYFTSEISATGNDDIYKLDIVKLYRNFNGKVVDDKTNLPIANSKVDLLDCNAHIIRTILTDNQGNFSFEVVENLCPMIEASKEGYNFVRKSILELDDIELRLKYDR